MPTSEPSFEPTPELSMEPSFEPTLEPTVEPTVEPSMDPTAIPTQTPTGPMPSEAPTTNGARCRTFVNREVHSGFQHHAQSFAAGVTSDDACRDRCTVAPGCTIWVRQPSTNMCWLSTQTGSITLRRS